MSSISPSESQYYKELITPFQPMGRGFYGADLRGTQCDRRGDGNLMLACYGDSSGGYAFSPDNQDAAIAPSLGSSNLSNISNSLPRDTEQQDFSGKWIDTIILHALDEFIEQTQPQSFIANTFRIFAGGQKGYRGDGTGKLNQRNTYTLLAEIAIPALTRADIPRSFQVKVGAYVPPAQNLYLGLAIPQPYTCSFQLWDLQANTLVGSGTSSSIGGSSTVANGNELAEDIIDPSLDTQFILPITFSSATWIRGFSSISGVDDNPSPPPPSTDSPLSPTPSGGGGGSSRPSPSRDSDASQPSSSGSSSPTSPAPKPSSPVPPPSEGGCVPIQDCIWYPVTKTQSATVDLNLSGGTSLCPVGTIARGIIDFETSGSFVLCCGSATYPPNNLGCSSLTKWSCVSGGNCVQDILGVYSSQAECQAALVPPTFTGGQSTGVGYFVRVKAIYPNGDTWYSMGNNPQKNNTVFDGSQKTGKTGAITSVRWIPATRATVLYLTANGSEALFGEAIIADNFNNVYPTSVTIDLVERIDGLPDTGGNLPPTCP